MSCPLWGGARLKDKSKSESETLYYWIPAIPLVPAGGNKRDSENDGAGDDPPLWIGRAMAPPPVILDFPLHINGGRSLGCAFAKGAVPLLLVLLMKAYSSTLYYWIPAIPFVPAGREQVR